MISNFTFTLDTPPYGWKELLAKQQNPKYEKIFTGFTAEGGVYTVAAEDYTDLFRRMHLLFGEKAETHLTGNFQREGGPKCQYEYHRQNLRVTPGIFERCVELTVVTEKQQELEDNLQSFGARLFAQPYPHVYVYHLSTISGPYNRAFREDASRLERALFSEPYWHLNQHQEGRLRYTLRRLRLQGHGMAVNTTPTEPLALPGWVKGNYESIGKIFNAKVDKAYAQRDYARKVATRRGYKSSTWVAPGKVLTTVTVANSAAYKTCWCRHPSRCVYQQAWGIECAATVAIEGWQLIPQVIQVGEFVI